METALSRECISRKRKSPSFLWGVFVKVLDACFKYQLRSLSVCQYLGIKRGIRLIRTVAVENTDLFLSIGDADNLVITEFLWFNFNPVSNVTWRIDLRIKTSMLCTSHRNCFSTILLGVLIFSFFRFPLTSLSVSPDARALSTSAHSKPCPKGMHKHRKVKYAESCLCYASIWRDLTGLTLFSFWF